METNQYEILSHLDRGPGCVTSPVPAKFLEQDRLLEVILTHGNNTQVQHGSAKKNKKHKTLFTQLLHLYPGILDDENFGMMKIILHKSHQWDFNAFLLDRFSGGHSLSTLCLHIFHSTGKISLQGSKYIEIENILPLIENICESLQFEQNKENIFKFNQPLIV